MNEELQSSNEELQTVNEELKSKLDELAQLNADYMNFLESTQIATLFIDRDVRVRAVTPAARTLFDMGERDIGAALPDLLRKADEPALAAAIDSALGGKASGARQVDLSGATYTMRVLPYTDGAGEVDGAVLVFEDVTQLVEAQASALSLERVAAASRVEIERLYETAPIGMALIDCERRYRRINASLAAYNGVPQDDHLGRTITEMLPEIGPRLDGVLDEVFATGRGVTDWELSAPAPQDADHEETFELDIYPLEDPDEDRVDRVGIIVRRVTEARRMEAELRDLMGELQHRVKNSLATVMGIVRQTTRFAPDPATLSERLVSRIGALAATHSLITSAAREGVSLRRVVGQEVAPYVDGGRVVIDGPVTRLNGKAAVTFTLVVHELTTNAAKYGALSDPDGHLSITWSIDGTGADATLRLDWAETVTHAVEPPVRRGFGLRFVERSATHDLDASVNLTWAPDGLRCTLAAPIARITDGASFG